MSCMNNSNNTIPQHVLANKEKYIMSGSWFYEGFFICFVLIGINWPGKA